MGTADSISQRLANGEVVILDDLSPSRYVEEALGWADAGVQLIGGCCGTGPDYIRALAEGLPGRVAGAGKEASAR